MNTTMIFSKNIQYFVKCAELRSLSKASRVLYLSQSALSVAIKRLEEELGAQIFKRGRGQGSMLLTPQGEQLLAFIRQQETSASELLNPQHAEERPLKIAAIQYFSRKYLLPALEKTRLIDSSLVFTVRTHKAIAALSANEIDLAFVLSHSRPLKDAAYCVELKQESVGIVGLKSKFPSIAKAKSYEELKGLPLIVGDRIREDWAQCLNSYKRAYYIEDHYSAKMLVLGGYGIAPFQLDYFSKEELKELAVSKFKMPSTGMKLFAVINRNRPTEVIEKAKGIISEVKRMMQSEQK